jgi:hypothetical protein
MINEQHQTELIDIYYPHSLAGRGKEEHPKLSFEEFFLLTNGF